MNITKRMTLMLDRDIVASTWYYNMVAGLSDWLDAVSTISAGEKIPSWLFGSSIGVGYAADNRETEGYFQILEAFLENKYGNAGGLVPVASTGWTVGAGWAGTGGFSPYSYLFTGDAGAAGTLSKTISGKSFDIEYYTYSDTNVFTVQIDSEDPVTIGATGTGTLTFAKDTVVASADGSHTITITPGAGGKARIWAVNATLDTDGVQVNNASRNGTGVSQYYGNSEINALTTVQPKLTIIALTTNDYNSQTSLATYKSQLEIIIDKALLYGSCLCISEPEQLDQSKAIKQSEYNDQMLASSLDKGAAYISITDKWGGYDANLMDGDGVHPNTTGHADMANALELFL